MIKTVELLSDFEEQVNFGQDIYYSSHAKRSGSAIPVIELTQKMYGIGRDGASLVIYDRLSTVSFNDAKGAPDVLRGIDEEVRRRVTTFGEEAKQLAGAHDGRAVPGDLQPSPMSAALGTLLAQRLESIEDRLDRLQHLEGEIQFLKGGDV